MRREKIAARQALSAATHALLSQQVDAHLQALLQRYTFAMLGFCWPMRGEFDCRPLVRQQLARGACACLPCVVDSGAALQFRLWQAGSAMLPDRYGIPYPTAGAIVIPDFLLLPVNAFDSQGYRLGYGGGYFDRTLAALQPCPLAVGVGFELARVASTLPGEHDIALDAVVTEAGVSYCSARMNGTRPTTTGPAP